jgi:hypothetical protein
MKVSAIRNQLMRCQPPAAAAEAEMPRHQRAERRRQHLDQRIADADRRAAFGAAPAQREPAQQRNVLPGAIGALQAGQVERGAIRLKRAARARPAAPSSSAHCCAPLALEHDRQPVDDHVQKAADHQAEQHAPTERQRVPAIAPAGQHRSGFSRQTTDRA